MSIAGGAVGLIASGLLVTYLNWRWVFFVNVPIGLAVALLAPRVLGESERRRGQFDLPGAITGSPGPGRPRLRAVQRRDQPERRVALGRHQGDRVAGGRGGAAGVVRDHRGAQQVRADADPGAAQPGPVRRLPDQPVHRHRAVRHVLLPHAVRAERAGVQRAEDRRLLPADGRHDHGRVRGGVAAGEPDRRPAADDRRERGRHRRDVLAVPGHRAQPLRRPACSGR